MSRNSKSRWFRKRNSEYSHYPGAFFPNRRKTTNRSSTCSGINQHNSITSTNNSDRVSIKALVLVVIEAVAVAVEVAVAVVDLVVVGGGGAGGGGEGGEGATAAAASASVSLGIGPALHPIDSEPRTRQRPRLQVPHSHRPAPQQTPDSPTDQPHGCYYKGLNNYLYYFGGSLV